MKFIVMTVQNIQNRNWMKVKKKLRNINMMMKKTRKNENINNIWKINWLVRVSKQFNMRITGRKGSKNNSP